MSYDYGEIRNRFMFHPAADRVTQVKHQRVRNLCEDVAQALVELLPDSRERSLAITRLEEVMFWGNAAVARHQSGD